MAADPRHRLGLDLGERPSSSGTAAPDRRRPAPSAWRRVASGRVAMVPPSARTWIRGLLMTPSLSDLKKRSASGARSARPAPDRRATRSAGPSAATSWRSTLPPGDRARSIRPPARPAPRASRPCVHLPPARLLRAVVERGLQVEPRLARHRRRRDRARSGPRRRAGRFPGCRNARRTAVPPGETRVDHLVDGLARHLDDEGIVVAAHGVPDVAGICADALRRARRHQPNGSARSKAAAEQGMRFARDHGRGCRTSRAPRPRCSSRARRRGRSPRARAWPDRRSRRRPASTRAPRRRRRSRCPGPWRDAAACRSCRPGSPRRC